MDQYGAVIKRYLDKMASDNIRQATDLAEDMLRDGYTYSQAKELLFAHGFSEQEISTVMASYPKANKKK